MEDLKRLGPPQIKLAELEIWIHRRQFPDGNDYWDGNWVYATAHCTAPGAEVFASGPIIHLPEIERWHHEAARMQETLSGTASLACMEPELSVQLSVSDHLGHITMEAEITPDNLHQQHKFKFDIDQSYLQPLLAECSAILEGYPIRGERPVAR